ncbi:MAG: T9SS type A sorting domain-containing protein [Bacteroidota bacterium]
MRFLLLFPTFVLALNIVFAQDENIDLKLQLSTATNNAPLYTKTPFTLFITNEGEYTATNLQIQFAVQKPTVVFVGETPITTSKGFYQAHGNQVWTIESLAPQESATLDLELFFLETPELFAEVIQVDQADVDSTPNNGKQGEDDESSFPIVSDCSFLEQYVFDPPFLSDIFDDLRKGIELTETDDLYQIAGDVFDEFGYLNGTYELDIDKKGMLEEFLVTVSPAPNPPIVKVGTDNVIQFTKFDDSFRDTLFNRFIEVDYISPTAVVVNSPVRELSNGYLFGGFIVDTEGEQMFTGFLVKTDLNGENAQTMLISDIDDTLGFREVLEDENGRLFIFWSAAGNFTITGTNAAFTSTWARQFASDTPSTRLNDLKLSASGSTIYLGITDNLQGEVIAYDAVTGEDTMGGLEIFRDFPYNDEFRLTYLSGLLPLSNGNLLVSFGYTDRSSNGGYEYGLVNSEGIVIWSESKLGEFLTLIPVAQTRDGGFLFLGQNTPNNFIGLTALKVNFDGSQTPSCEEENIIPTTRSIPSELMTLSPNPVTNLLYLNINQEEKIEEWIQVFDMRGRVVLNKQMQLYKGKNAVELDVSTLAKGIYFVKIINQTPQKLIKQ